MTVYFIGAGPGDPELITVRGKRLIEEAPVVLYAGSLVPPAVIAMARPDALVVDTAPLTLDEIIAHLADCELVYGFRYRKILAEPGSTLAAFDQDAWAMGLQYQNQVFKPLLESFGALRRANLALLRAITLDAWNKAGRHPEYGTLTIGQLVLHLVTHDRNHIAQVEDRLGRPRLR